MTIEIDPDLVKRAGHIDKSGFDGNIEVIWEMR